MSENQTYVALTTESVLLLLCMVTGLIVNVLQNQKAITTYFTSKQLLFSGFVESSGTPLLGRQDQ